MAGESSPLGTEAFRDYDAEALEDEASGVLFTGAAQHDLLLLGLKCFFPAPCAGCLEACRGAGDIESLGLEHQDYVLGRDAKLDARQASLDYRALAREGPSGRVEERFGQPGGERVARRGRIEINRRG